MTAPTSEALRERVREVVRLWRVEVGSFATPERDRYEDEDYEKLVTAVGALVAEARLEAGLLSVMPGRACARPEHNGGDGRRYGVMCGGCAFELAQDEAAEARREQRELDSRAVCDRCAAGQPIGDADECIALGHFRYAGTCHPFSWDTEARVVGHVPCEAAGIRRVQDAPSA